MPCAAEPLLSPGCPHGSSVSIRLAPYCSLLKKRSILEIWEHTGNLWLDNQVFGVLALPLPYHVTLGLIYLLRGKNGCYQLLEKYFLLGKWRLPGLIRALLPFVLFIEAKPLIQWEFFSSIAVNIAICFMKPDYCYVLGGGFWTAILLK